MSSIRKPIVVIGSVNVDFVVTADTIPLPGETIAGHEFQTHFGGKGANQAVAVAKLGYPVEMIGMVGSDSFGEQLRAGLRDAGVGVGAIGIAAGTTGIAAITVSQTGDNSIVVVPGANEHVTPDFVTSHEGLIQQAGLVLVQLEIPLSSITRVVELCNRHGVRVMLDPAPAKPLPSSVLAGVTWFTPNETEAAFFAQQINPTLVDAPSEAVADAFASTGITSLALKQGSRGVLLLHNGTHTRVPAPAVHALDTTAAGDAFNGAFATALMLDMNPEDAARFACAAAAISVTRRGAQGSMPSRAEVESLLPAPRDTGVNESAVAEPGATTRG